MKYPTNHEELLLMAIKERVSVIGEFSGSIRMDRRELQRWAQRYANKNSLNVNLSDDEMFGIYYEDEEQDAEINAELDRRERKK